MNVDIQTLVSQLYGINAETVRQSAVAPTDGSCSASTINEIYRNQQESKDILQNMMQAISRLTLNGTAGPQLDQRTETEASHFQASTSTKLSSKSVDGGVGFESSLSLSMSVTRTGKIDTICSPECQCNCHIQTVLKTPQLLQKVTGCLLLGYSGRPIFRQQCISSCFREDSKPLQITYFFPSWFVSRAITFSMSNAMRSTPTLNIKFRRVVPEASQLFSLSKFGDVDGIRTLFESGLASPDDIHFRGGWTALHVSTLSISLVSLTRS